MFSHFKGSTFDSSFHFVLDAQIRGTSADLPFECKVAGPWLIDFESWLMQMKSAREINKEMYFSRFPGSIESLTRYLVGGPIENPNQILFLIVDEAKNLYGHIGLKMDDKGDIHVDNVLRVASDSPGIIRVALQGILSWGNKNLGISEYGLQVISTNRRAIALYEDLGFFIQTRKNLKIERLPNNRVNLVPSTKENSNTTEEMLIMKVKL